MKAKCRSATRVCVTFLYVKPRVPTRFLPNREQDSHFSARVSLSLSSHTTPTSENIPTHSHRHAQRWRPYRLFQCGMRENNRWNLKKYRSSERARTRVAAKENSNERDQQAILWDQHVCKGLHGAWKTHGKGNADDTYSSCLSPSQPIACFCRKQTHTPTLVQT